MHRAGTPEALFAALPPFWGGKRQLAPLIFSLLSAHVPTASWRTLRLLDPMCGGGAVALYAKALGFEVAASDSAERSAIVARALVANSTQHLVAADLAGLATAEAKAITLARSVSERLTPGQADGVRRLLALAATAAEPRRSLLQLLLIRAFLRLYPMSSPAATDARAAAVGDYDRITPRRLAHYLQARAGFAPGRLWALAEAINGGIVPGTGTALRGDARDVIPRVPTDVLYLDPPYVTTTRYDRAYDALDVLLGDENATPSTSATFNELLDAAREVPWVICSYGGPRASLEGVRDLVARHRTVVSATAVPYQHLRVLASEVTNASNREFIVIARR